MMLSAEVPVTLDRTPRLLGWRAQISGDAVDTAARPRDNRKDAAYADSSGTYRKGVLQDGTGIVNQAAAGGPLKEALVADDPGEFKCIVTGGVGVLLLLVYALSTVTLYHWSLPV